MAAALVMMPPAALQSRRDAAGVVAGLLPRLADAAEQEDLVVHREAEERAEHQDRSRRLDEAERREVQQVAEVPSWKMKTSAP